MEKMYQNYKTFRSMNPLVLILGLIFGLFIIFWFIKNIVFKVLYLAAPVLFVGALLMNYRVVVGYFKWLFNSYKGNVWFGLAATGLTIVGYPFVSAYLAFRAYHLRGATNTGQSSGPREGDYIKYEEVKEEDFLDISKEKKKTEQISTDYEDLI